MHYRLEAWSVPGTGPFVRKLGDIPATSADISEPDDDYGYGTIDIPASWAWLSRIIKVDPVTPANNTNTLIRGYADDAAVDDPSFEFFASFADHALLEDGAHVVRIHGPGIGDRLNEAVVHPWSTEFPDWVWGGRELLTNPRFEDGIQATEYEIWHDGDGGTFTLDVTVPGGVAEETALIQWDETAEGLATILLATNITEVSVTGDGTEDSPWRITIFAPEGNHVLVVNQNNLTNTTVGIVRKKPTEGGLTGTDPWTRSTNLDTGKPHGKYSSDGFRLLDSTEIGAGLVIEGEQSLRINGLNQYAGLQQDVGGIKPGSPLTAHIDVRTEDPDNRFRLVMRDLNEELLETTPETVIPADHSVNRISLDNFVLTDTSTGVIWRFAHTRDTNPTPFIVDNASLREGLAPTTAGEEAGLLFDHAKTRGRFAWLERTWTNTHDSNGVLWDEAELELAFRRGMKYGNHVFSKLRDMGYEWEILPKPGAGQGDTITHQLHLYNPEGRGTNKETAQHPALTPGHITEGSAPQRAPRYTRLLLEGPNGNRTTVEDTDLGSAFGVIEDYLPDEEALTTAALTREGTTALEREAKDLIGFKAVLTGDTIIARRDVNVGDKINWLIPPHADKHARRISSIRHRLRTREGEQLWSLEITASRVRSPEAAKSLALRRLLTAYKGVPERAPFGALPSGRGAGDPTVFVACADATELSKAMAHFQLTGADDQHVLNEAAAAATGGRVVVSEGTANLTGSFTLPSGVGLLGLGWFSTTFEQAAAGNWPMLRVNRGGRLAHFYLSGWEGGGVEFYGTSRTEVTIDHVYFDLSTDNAPAILSDAGLVRGRIRDNVFSGTSQLADLIQITTPQDVWIDNNWTTGGRHAINLIGGAHIKVRGNHIESCGRNGILRDGGATGASWCQITGNTIQQAGQNALGDAAIRIIGDATRTVIGNAAGDAEQFGLQIRGNTIENVAQGKGIWVTDTETGIIADNDVEDADEEGLLLQTCSAVAARGNEFRFCAEGTTNTFDVMRIEGGDRCALEQNQAFANRSAGASDRAAHAINIVSGTNHRYLGNALGLTADWATAPVADTGTGTINTYPGDATIGDNFLD